MIRVRYSASDGFKKTRTYKTLKGAQRFAQSMVGPSPEMGTTYAISGDGIGKVEVTGATLEEIFPGRRIPADQGLGYMQGRGAA